ncbi:hypothetical protein ACTXGQ_11880 [Marinobacter sp. 1Y8]
MNVAKVPSLQFVANIWHLSDKTERNVLVDLAHSSFEPYCDSMGQSITNIREHSGCSDREGKSEGAGERSPLVRPAQINTA